VRIKREIPLRFRKYQPLIMDSMIQTPPAP
jgi:hypothetical protein